MKQFQIKKYKKKKKKKKKKIAYMQCNLYIIYII